MSKLDNLIGKFFDNLRKGVVNKFGKELLKDPEVQKHVKALKQVEDDLLKKITKIQSY